APPPSPDLGSWFGAVLARLFPRDGLVLVEPDVVAPFAGPVLGRLARGAAALTEALRVGGDEIREPGAPPPLDVSHGDAPLFLRETPGGPRRRPSALAVPLSGEALARRVESEPTLASGDVVGRLAVQNALLPVVAMVAGPAELAYAAQAAPGLEAALGTRFPAVVPRPSATWD